ncbi:ROK family transcriptional regulator [Paenibacillus koleovorans]|uniref:ROK family transcriptional regulator n=1 Tax=Paenibacillus koleovorans TaxID=121608 RepID=UPI000FD8883C|nr:ROK family transcriptional regulator [Paenibacillus koleovorans]
MKPTVTGNSQWMKSLNRSLVLNKIREDGPISRADVAKRTSLTPPTVTHLVQELLEERYIVESDIGVSSGGRKPILLRLNPEAYYSIGIDVGVHSVKSVVSNLSGEIILQDKRLMPSPVSGETLLQLLVQSVQELLAGSSLHPSALLGIGIGMHGLVNPMSGLSLFAPNLGLRGVPLKEELERRTGIPVHVENDAAAMALGELWFGGGQGLRDFICVNIGEGVGAGIVVDGRLHRGSRFSAGEIGHTTVDLNGPRCSCGNYGCLQTQVSGPAIADKLRKHLALGGTSRVLELADGELERITGQLVYEAAQQGDPAARDAFRQTGQLLGISLTNLIHTLNPEKIILGGGVSQAGAYILDPVHTTVRSRALESTAEGLTIEASPLGELATAIGAVTIVLSKLFSPSPSPPVPQES